MRSNDINSLEQLHRVRTSRLVTLERTLQEKMTVLRGIEDEAATCRAELAEVRRQRDAWESEWQSWLRTHGVLSRGEDYSRYHVALLSWERDVCEQLAEIEARLRVAATAVDTARAVVRKAQAKLEALGEKLQRARHSLAHARSMRLQREAAELATIAARQVRAAWSSDLVRDGT
jgi:chromosome segregation ATPase